MLEHVIYCSDASCTIIHEVFDHMVMTVQATAKEYGTAYGRDEEEEEVDDIRLETAADREALRSSDAFYNDNIPAPQVRPFSFLLLLSHLQLYTVIVALRF